MYCLQFFYPDISKTDYRAMAQESDMSRGPFQPRMFIVICRSILAGFCDITIQDYLAIEGDFYPVSFGHNFFVVPITYRLKETALCWNYAVHRSVVLVCMKVFINR